MKLLVFSDTHGDVEAMRDIISRHRNNVDIVIHLGDCLKDLQSVMVDFPTIANLGVMGNCDYAFMYPNAKYEGTFTVEGIKIFYTHGHKYNVKNGYDYIVSNAKFNNAGIVLFGHSHVSVIEKRGDVTVINPGSLSYPRDSSLGTYAMLEIKDGKLKAEIKELDL